MPTYVYEVVSPDPDAEPRQFEVFQRMSDEPLTVDPESGRPVRRVFTVAVGIRLKGLRRSTVVNKKSAAATACGCGRTGKHRHTLGAASSRGPNH